MAVVTSCWIFDILLVIVSVFLAAYLKFRFTENYWKKRNVPHEEPYFLLGNTPLINFKKSMMDYLDEMYEKHKNHKIFGCWLYTNPILLVHDLQIIKSILVKDFQHFHDRGFPINEELDPLNG